MHTNGIFGSQSLEGKFKGRIRVESIAIAPPGDLYIGIDGYIGVFIERLDENPSYYLGRARTVKLS